MMDFSLKLYVNAGVELLGLAQFFIRVVPIKFEEL